MQSPSFTEACTLQTLVECCVQGLVEGGFMGRTNKLVDGCYSFWQGGLFPLLQRVWPQYLQQSGVPRGPLPQAAIAIPPLPPLSTLGPLEQAQAETARLKASGHYAHHVSLRRFQ